MPHNERRRVEKLAIDDVTRFGVVETFVRYGPYMDVTFKTNGSERLSRRFYAAERITVFSDGQS